jgi:hypothetical protein
MKAWKAILIVTSLGALGFGAFKLWETKAESKPKAKRKRKKRAKQFTASISPLPDSLKAQMRGVSWHEGCPVPLEDLSLVKVRYRNYQGANATGRLIIASDVAQSLVDAFRDLYQSGFPIEKMQPVYKFGGSDAESMRANNTSAFNCRKSTGSSKWSEHSKGTAIDINPVVNPYVSSGGSVQPIEGAKYADRSIVVKGTITPEIAAIFDRHGWKWGGDWRSTKDYQHFSRSGR